MSLFILQLQSIVGNILPNLWQRCFLKRTAMSEHSFNDCVKEVKEETICF